MRAVGLLLLCSLPAFAEARIEVDEKTIILGRTESAAVHFLVDEGPGEAERPLRISVNVGTFGEVTREGPGRYRAVYVPPSTRFPQVALVAVWRETGADAPIDFFRIPLHGVTRLPVTTKPNSKVTVALGDQSFGPVKADGRGAAQVTLVVPPGVLQAEVTAEDARGVQTRGSSEIDVPPYNRITAAMVPHAIVADGKARARLEVFYDLGGVDLPPERISVAASLGEPSFEFAKQGRYVYRYTPPAGTAETAARFDVSVQGDLASKAHSQLALGLPAPSRVVLRPPTQALAADGRSTATVQLLVFDAAGLALPGQAVQLTANGEPVPAVTELGDGVYEGLLTAPKRYPQGGLLQLVATAGQARATVNLQLRAAPLPADLTTHFSPARVPADGRTLANVIFEVRDASGGPLEGAELLLSTSQGVLGPLEVMGNGRYRASYIAQPDALDYAPELRVTEPTGAFQRVVAVPLRADSGRLLLGVRAGLTHSLGELVTPRAGLDAWVPVRIGGAVMGAGLSATVSRVSQRHEAGGLSTQSDATVVPLGLRFGVELLARERVSLTAGLGGQATWVSFKTSLTGAEEATVGFGGAGFVSLNAAVGPGEAFAEAGYAYAPVRGELFELDAGGIGLTVGYRFRVF